MKTTYQKPKIEIITLQLEEVIAASPFGGGAPPHPDFTMVQGDEFNPPINLV